MKAIKLLVEEHKNIKRVLAVARKLSLNVLEKDEVDFQSFYDIIDVVRNYADKHHHSKEEKILFKKMSEELGEPLASGPITAMFSEHDLGRLFIYNLEAALEKVKEGDQEAKLDIIANTIAYTDLLHRHIDKEDNTIYTFGENNLTEESLVEVEEECNRVEENAAKEGIQDKYLTLISDLEKRVK
ncbi:hemerythrin domain-containing protein [Orenia marismortui]|uniref:Hemerythrin-like domain-containing protein n=1 Tax=Orenia marismortui TaxID=46469 RepID=A0A4V6QB95_9FIRM|nr:hemerythrin domain-containing protein [Orenia marismortui]TDX51626.1 hemerythrin-like domain-containing protein [Orenia marismortui]